MNAIEKRMKDLYSYNADIEPPVELDAFWQNTFKAASSRPLVGVKELTETPFSGAADVYHVTFEGYDDTPIKGWFMLPKFAAPGPLPCVVLFHGYTGGKGYPESYAEWLLMGMAVFAVDVRGQGGETGNRMDSDHGMTKGWITQGILDKDTCYYKAITVDALKAVEWVAAQPEIDRARIAVTGDSQGGGLSMITAALSSVPAAVVANIPNMCHMDFGILNSTGSLTEAAEFVNRFPEHYEKVLNTLSYFDLVHLAEMIHVPIMVSVGLKDTVCMPETVFAAYNRITAEKALNIYPFTGHHVSSYQKRQTMEFLKKHL
ncbi:alpha/beta fold hydrolase [Paenibacillus sp. NEAU-GSW1]|uniref:acetylxylan esterase n=1 Tax=Paenibacillus sp. NEAU-GSW1 TaxID=2682486 RepID=UPI0012E192AC|nr:alpha/beta fold hydrolase [Paenibacillus sp. NEAU-GSW1]MUT67464.1 prolyl oligopeptidase family serine peptidase [Paenibacillus sp. NEAU-GSW1]